MRFGMELNNKVWPKTVGEAVEQMISCMARDEKEEIRSMEEKDLFFLHLGFGENIRNQCGLWAGNVELLKSCGSEGMHPDDASMVIIEALWRRLQTRH
jgi:hypothetical protein